MSAKRRGARVRGVGREYESTCETEGMIEELIKTKNLFHIVACFPYHPNISKPLPPLKFGSASWWLA